MTKWAHTNVSRCFTSNSAGTESDHSPIAYDEMLPFSIPFCFSEASKCFKNTNFSYKQATKKHATCPFPYVKDVAWETLQEKQPH